MTADIVRQRIKGMTVLVARSDAGRIIGTIGGGVHGTEGHLRGGGAVIAGLRSCL